MSRYLLKKLFSFPSNGGGGDGGGGDGGDGGGAGDY